MIHYCWFGKGEKPQLILECIESWKKYCPDYEIMEWNEDNFDINCCPYAFKAYSQKRYGFLSDVARLKIIYENGGIYLDTDVELRRSLDELLNNGAWFAYGTATEINTGSGFGAVVGHKYIEKLLKQYLDFDKKQSFELCTRLDTQVFKTEFKDFAGNHSITQKFDDILIINNIWHFVIHHYTGTWQTKAQKLFTKMRNILSTFIH